MLECLETAWVELSGLEFDVDCVGGCDAGKMIGLGGAVVLA